MCCLFVYGTLICLHSSVHDNFYTWQAYWYTLVHIAIISDICLKRYKHLVLHIQYDDSTNLCCSVKVKLRVLHKCSYEHQYGASEYKSREWPNFQRPVYNISADKPEHNLINSQANSQNLALFAKYRYKPYKYKIESTIATATQSARFIHMYSFTIKH